MVLVFSFISFISSSSSGINIIISDNSLYFPFFPDVSWYIPPLNLNINTKCHNELSSQCYNLQLFFHLPIAFPQI